MNKSFNAYIDSVIKLIACDKKTASVIRDDLMNSLVEKQIAMGIDDPIILMGSKESLAQEFRENLNIISPSYNTFNFGINGYEYVSKTKLLGIPLVHINTKRNSIAKGIIAIGGLSIGVVAIGGISLGIVSLGGLAVGLLLGIGGVSISGMVALGGVAVSYFLSLGGCSLAHDIAIGGYASAKLAIGDIAKGTIAIYKQEGSGEYLFRQPLKEIYSVLQNIKEVLPQTPKILLDFIKLFL